MTWPGTDLALPGTEPELSGRAASERARLGNFITLGSAPIGSGPSAVPFFLGETPVFWEKEAHRSSRACGRCYCGLQGPGRPGLGLLFAGAGARSPRCGAGDETGQATSAREGLDTIRRCAFMMNRSGP